MTLTNRPYAVSAKRQFAALASSARQELIDVLQRLGTVSVAEIAAALAKPADALYYHVRVLERVGLLVRAGHRCERGRQEALYRAVSPHIVLRHEPRTPARSEAIGDIVGSMLRLGTRDYRRALKESDVRLTGDDRDLWALRTTGWLTKEQVKKVNALIAQLVREASRPKQAGQLYGLTLLFTPLTGRDRTNERRQE
ncbi:MAG TPA: helix-turn-helix domain-containing protein [Candidatus Eremiobacteraceae bacterium]|nr:helix-turn-helix domain-containing protein [Candidatus Eremiobacteraceae bacterium]